jgi:uncharacterized protein (TIGR04255 family)
MGKRLANAPVFYTIAQVRHNPVLRIEDPACVSNMQDRFRKMGYSDYQSHTAIDISLPDPSLGINGQNIQPKITNFERHIFTNLDSSKSFVVDRNSVSFQTTAYDVFETFSSDFAGGLTLINEVVDGFDFVSRLGIRYLDVINPKESGEQELRKFLQPGLLGVTSSLPDQFLVNYSVSECHSFYPSVGNVLTRALISGGKLALPQDIQIIGVKIQEKFSSTSGVHAVIDTDASSENRQPFKIEDILNQLDKLHIAASNVFKSSITSYAIEVWS